jgi:hypothetical protein
MRNSSTLLNPLAVGLYTSIEPTPAEAAASHTSCNVAARRELGGTADVVAAGPIESRALSAAALRAFTDRLVPAPTPRRSRKRRGCRGTRSADGMGTALLLEATESAETFLQKAVIERRRQVAEAADGLETTMAVRRGDYQAAKAELERRRLAHALVMADIAMGVRRLESLSAHLHWNVLNHIYDRDDL